MKRTTTKSISLREHPLCLCLTKSPVVLTKQSLGPQQHWLWGAQDSPLALFSVLITSLDPAGGHQVQTCYRAMPESRLQIRERHWKEDGLYTRRLIPFGKSAWHPEALIRWDREDSSVSKVLAMSAWQPEFSSQNQSKKAGCVGTHL